MIIKLDLGNEEFKLYDGCTDIQYAKNISIPEYLEELNSDFCPTRYADLYTYVQRITFGQPKKEDVIDKKIVCDFYGTYEPKRKYTLIQFTRGESLHYAIGSFPMYVCSDVGGLIETLTTRE